jgi:hypothetical protein
MSWLRFIDNSSASWTLRTEQQSVLERVGVESDRLGLKIDNTTNLMIQTVGIKPELFIPSGGKLSNAAIPRKPLKVYTNQLPTATPASAPATSTASTPSS